MVSIQRLDELHRAVNAEATAVAIGNTLDAVGMTGSRRGSSPGSWCRRRRPGGAPRPTRGGGGPGGPAMADAVGRISAAARDARRGETAGRGDRRGAPDRALGGIQEYRAVTKRHRARRRPPSTPS
jgi:hypothetical protein